MKSQAGQCAPFSSLTHGPICQDVAALVIISGADRLFPLAVACVSAPNWEKGHGDSWLGFFFCCFLFMDISSSALQVLKMFLVFFGWNKKTSLHFLFCFSPNTFCRERAGDKMK